MVWQPARLISEGVFDYWIEPNVASGIEELHDECSTRVQTGRRSPWRSWVWQGSFSRSTRLAIFGRGAARYGSEITDWQPFGHRERLRFAEHAVAVAERRNFNTAVLGVGAAADAVAAIPAIVLIDPWITVEENGAKSDALRDLKRLFSADRRR